LLNGSNSLLEMSDVIVLKSHDLYRMLQGCSIES